MATVAAAMGVFMAQSASAQQCASNNYYCVGAACTSSAPLAGQTDACTGTSATPTFTQGSNSVSGWLQATHYAAVGCGGQVLGVASYPMYSCQQIASSVNGKPLFRMYSYSVTTTGNTNAVTIYDETFQQNTVTSGGLTYISNCGTRVSSQVVATTNNLPASAALNNLCVPTSSLPTSYLGLGRTPYASGVRSVQFGVSTNPSNNVLGQNGFPGNYRLWAVYNTFDTTSLNSKSPYYASNAATSTVCANSYSYYPLSQLSDALNYNYGYVAAYFATPLANSDTCNAQPLGGSVGCQRTAALAANAVPWSVIVDTATFYPSTFYTTYQAAVNCAPTGRTEPNQLPSGGFGTTWLSATSYLQLAGSNQGGNPNNIVCGGVTSGITYYQLNTCIPTTYKFPKFASSGIGNQTVVTGSQMYTVTATDLGPTPGYQVFVDQYADSNCQFCSTCGNAAALVIIPAATTSACVSGSSFSVVNYRSGLGGTSFMAIPGRAGLPPLAVNYLTTYYYSDTYSCQTPGFAPGIVQFTPTLATDKNGVCRTNWLSCTTPSTYTGAAPSYGQLTTAVLNGYTTYNPINNFVPYTPFVSQGCASYNLTYLALLALLVIPLIIGIFVGFFVPQTPCPGCPGTRPGIGYVPPHFAFQSAGFNNGPNSTVVEPKGVSIQV